MSLNYKIKNLGFNKFKYLGISIEKVNNNAFIEKGDYLNEALNKLLCNNVNRLKPPWITILK